MTELTQYSDFVAAKVDFRESFGFPCADAEIHPVLFPHQRAIVRWAVEGGRRAIFAAFGLGKTPIQLETVRIVRKYSGGRALIVCPLGVRQEFRRDGEMLGIRTRFVRFDAQVSDDPGEDVVYLTNYESIRDGRLSTEWFDVVSLDEASVLRSFGSKTFQGFLASMADVPYRFVATATPSPNRYKELIHYAGFLGVMDTGQALTRFFKRDSTKANHLTLFPHKVREFYLWLASWSCFIQRPGDLCRCQCHANVQTSSVNDSDDSQSSDGTPPPSEMERRSAPATAAEATSRPLTTSGEVSCSAAAASDRSTAARGRRRTARGEASSDAAPTPTIRTGPTTGDEGSQSASAGDPSPTSSPTWASRHLGTRLTGSTTTATTNPETAGGRRPASRPRTDGHDGSESCRRCRCNDGYDLPELEIVTHEIEVDVLNHLTFESQGQGVLVRDPNGLGVVGASREKRSTLEARVAKAAELVNESPDDHFILWHNLEDERRALKKALPDVVEVYGSLDLDEREQRIIDFSDGESRLLATKPVLSGSGCNFQRHCHRAIFVGVDFKFNDFVQAVHRIHRFLQTQRVRIDIIHADTERGVLAVLFEKWAKHKELTDTMSDLIREHGLNAISIDEALKRSIGVDRIEASGEGWLAANNDCVIETSQMATDSVGLAVTSIPFSNHYEYTPSYNDFGHTDDNDHFWAQMDFLTRQMLRVLEPGRMYCVHVKDRILFGNVTGKGAGTVSPFHAEAITHHIGHGFDYMGMITVVTDVVRENNQTYRLSWSRMLDDATSMGVGSPEYILLFRKPQSNRAQSFADRKVQHTADEYPLARWQVDAHAFWRSNGDRPITAQDLEGLPVPQVHRLFADATAKGLYDFDAHVEIGDNFAGRGRLPTTFMLLAPGSEHPAVWADVNRMLTLNTSQAQKGQEQHVCPLQFDIVDRLIHRYSNPGDLVFDPFGGLMTVPVRALKAGRSGRGVELNPTYFLDGVKYLQAAEREVGLPTLFDMLDDHVDVDAEIA